MQAETNCTSTVSRTLPDSVPDAAPDDAPDRAPASAPETGPAGASVRRSRRPPNAFSDSFLVRAGCLEQPQSAAGALLAGPWDVEAIEVGHGLFHAVVRRAETLAEGGSAFAVLLDRSSALLTAAALPALARPDHLHQGRHRKRLGVPLHDGETFLGHLARPEPRLLPVLHALRSLQAQPDGLALLLESLGPEGLALLGRLLSRRVDTVS
jgi:hypothetical protein